MTEAEKKEKERTKAICEACGGHSEAYRKYCENCKYNER